jgi:hypothetical protein
MRYRNNDDVQLQARLEVYKGSSKNAGKGTKATRKRERSPSREMVEVTPSVSTSSETNINTSIRPANMWYRDLDHMYGKTVTNTLRAHILRRPDGETTYYRWMTPHKDTYDRTEKYEVPRMNPRGKCPFGCDTKGGESAMLQHVRKYHQPLRFVMECPQPMCDKKIAMESTQMTKHLHQHIDVTEYNMIGIDSAVIYGGEQYLLPRDLINQCGINLDLAPQQYETKNWQLLCLLIEQMWLAEYGAQTCNYQEILVPEWLQKKLRRGVKCGTSTMSAPGLPDRINSRRRVGEICDGQGDVPSVIPGWIPLGYVERDATRDIESDEEFIPEYRERVGAVRKIRNCEPLTQELRERTRRLSMTPVACRTRAKHASAPTKGAKRKTVKLTKQVSFTEVRDNRDEESKKRMQALHQESVRSSIPFKESKHTKKAKLSQKRVEAETGAMDSIDLSEEIARMVKNASNVEELIVVIDKQLAATAVD